MSIKVLSKILFFNLIACLIFALILEAIFNLLPTSDSEQTQAVNASNPYLHLVPNARLRITSGPFFEYNSIKRTNNFGYFSDIDYSENGAGKNLIVIGSSLVTANQVANEASFHGLLNLKLNRNGQLYMLAGANAPQSQYLAYSKLALEKFNPYALIFVIGSVDFRGSLLINALPNSGYHYFTNGDESGLLTLTDYYPSRTKELLRRSAFARYLFLNARVQGINFRQNVSSAVAPASRFADNQNLALIEKFLSALEALADGMPVLLVIDSLNQSERSANATVPRDMENAKRHLVDRARSFGFEVLDLSPFFVEDFKVNGRRFEWINDGHWNSDGHRVVASAIERSSVYQSFLRQ